MRDEEKKKFKKKAFHSWLQSVLIPAELIWTQSIELRGEFFFDIQKITPHSQIFFLPLPSLENFLSKGLILNLH